MMEKDLSTLQTRKLFKNKILFVYLFIFFIGKYKLSLIKLFILHIQIHQAYPGKQESISHTIILGIPVRYQKKLSA